MKKSHFPHSEIIKNWDLHFYDTSFMNFFMVLFVVVFITLYALGKGILVYFLPTSIILWDQWKLGLEGSLVALKGWGKGHMVVEDIIAGETLRTPCHYCINILTSIQICYLQLMLKDCLPLYLYLYLFWFSFQYTPISTSLVSFSVLCSICV